MTPVKRSTLCALALHLAVLPCFADVIPSRRAEKNSAAEVAVKARLEHLGLSAADADRHLRELTSDEVAYFAQNPDRIQAAGGLYWYEWLIGAGVLAGLTAMYFFVTGD